MKLFTHHQDSHKVNAVLTDRCAGCQECLVRCPTNAIGFNEDSWIVEINSELCVGCGQCERLCPFSAIVIEKELSILESQLNRHYESSGSVFLSVRETKPSIKTFDAALFEASRCLECPDPTCVKGCPAHNNIPLALKNLRSGDITGARTIFEETSHIGSICSRVCDQKSQCEGACSLALAGGGAVSIGALEKFIFDNSRGEIAEMVGTSKKVAIIGSGPAALGACYRLVEAGVTVEVFEEKEYLGGLLNYGIPDFTLPAETLEKVIEELSSAGVYFHTNHHVSDEELEDLRSHFDSVIVAIGANIPIRPKVDGIESTETMDAMDFLVRYGQSIREATVDYELYGKKLLIVGAGNTAMDVARVAKRLGAAAVSVEWVNAKFAKVRPDELEEAVAEGVDVRFQTTLIATSGRVATLVNTTHEDPSKLPSIIESSSYSEEFDLIVMALGYRKGGDIKVVEPIYTLGETPSPKWSASGILSKNHNRNQVIGSASWMRERKTRAIAGIEDQSLFAVGDFLYGPATVVEAMASGRNAADRIIATI
ncbi:MAG: FAD-dependent oxidoreductase [Actinomycetota bacterium]|nr:FAD-dependent oxidoreductase [Actinomycetota bacterium]